MTELTQALNKCTHCDLAEQDLSPAPLHLLRAQRTSSSWKENDQLCRSCLGLLHRELISQLIGKSQQELDRTELQVVQSLIDNQLISTDPEPAADSISWPDKLSDQIARFGGSWYFLSSFGLFLVVWIVINSLAMPGKPFDPFPFILLNLALSCLAAIQAPVILMSQKRQESRDRLRGINDYQVNLKAELEIRQLHLKLDLLLTHHWKQLSDIQELQVALLEDLLDQQGPRPAPEAVPDPT